eukprot:5293590-Pyramimonas_sp.AAC.1
MLGLGANCRQGGKRTRLWPGANCGQGALHNACPFCVLQTPESSTLHHHQYWQYPYFTIHLFFTGPPVPAAARVHTTPRRPVATTLVNISRAVRAGGSNHGGDSGRSELAVKRAHDVKGAHVGGTKRAAAACCPGRCYPNEGSTSEVVDGHGV